jgi:hypothetical protein
VSTEVAMSQSACSKSPTVLFTSRPASVNESQTDPPLKRTPCPLCADIVEKLDRWKPPTRSSFL